MLTAIWIAVLLALTLQIGYWIALWIGNRRAGRSIPDIAPAPLSVIVAARNEEEALPGLLEALARQTHGDYEVIIVNDASTDGTADVVRRAAQSDERIRLVEVAEPQQPRKKNALTLGIEAARHEHLAFTDADCRPAPGWLDALGRMHAHADEPLLITGYGPYQRGHGLLDALARYETFVAGVLTIGAAGLKRPYMAVGRNMSYPARLFEQIGGFDHSSESLSGDDDLLVQEVVRQNAARVIHPVHPSTFVYSAAPVRWSDWIRQKRRHASAGRFYSPGIKVHLGLFHTSQLITWLAPLLLGTAGWAALGARLLLQAVVLAYSSIQLRERQLVVGYPLLEPLYALYVFLIAPAGLLVLPRRW